MDDLNKLKMPPRNLAASPTHSGDAFAKARSSARLSGLHTRSSEVQKPIAFNGLLTNKILTGLPGVDFASLLSYLEPISLSAGQPIIELGQCIDFVYFPETAVVSHLYFLEDGSTTGAAIVGNEGVIGLSAVLDSRPASYWSQVTIGGSGIRVKAEIIRREFARGGAMQRLLLGYTRARLAQISQRAVCNGRHTLQERMCTWLLMVHDRVGDDQLSLTHENIAHHLGGRRAGVCTACNALRDLGIITYRRGQIRIENRELLEGIACECYKALQRFD